MPGHQRALWPNPPVRRELRPWKWKRWRRRRRGTSGNQIADQSTNDRNVAGHSLDHIPETAEHPDWIAKPVVQYLPNSCMSAMSAISAISAISVIPGDVMIRHFVEISCL